MKIFNLISLILNRIKEEKEKNDEIYESHIKQIKESDDMLFM
jgi:uncharacterized protein YacL